LHRWTATFVLLIAGHLNTQRKMDCVAASSFMKGQLNFYQSRWPRRVMSGSAAARWLEMRFRIPAAAWTSVSSKCCVSSGSGLCVGPITRPQESYRVWCIWVWSWNLGNKEALTHWGAVTQWKKCQIFMRN